MTLNFVLKLGKVAQSVTVTSATPLVNTATATSGTTLSSVDLAQLPLEFGNPIMLSTLAAGSQTNDTDGLGIRGGAGQLWQEQDPSIVNGVIDGTNEWTVDGAPQEINSNGDEGYNPPSDAVQEVDVITTHFDAQYGHTAGAVTNAVIKSGTNQLHGNVHEYLQNTVLDSNFFYANEKASPISPLHLNRYGLTVGGPVFIPKIYDGKDQTFFFFAFERQVDSGPEPRTDTIPTMAERTGDFSALLPRGITIYNPFTASSAPGGLVARSAFAGNIIPSSLISPIGSKILSYYPSPNLPGNQYGQDNYYTPDTLTDNFNTELWRLDHSFSVRDKALFDFYRGAYTQTRFNEFPKVNSVTPTEELLGRANYGGTYDQTLTLSSATVLDLRVSFEQNVEAITSGSAGFDPATLGFPSSTASLFQGAKYFPDISISDMEPIGGDFNQHGGGAGFFSRNYIYSFQPALSRVQGKHMFHAGLDFRAYRYNIANPSCLEGCYTFDTSFTNGPFNTSPSLQGGLGQGLASLLLGLPSDSSTIDRNASGAYQYLYYAPYFQDDWKATRKLTLNLGLRYELEGPVTERYNRNIRGFDLTSVNPIAAAARAVYSSAYNSGAYAKDSLAIPPANLNILGGYLFASPANRDIYNADTNNIEPRLGFAYAINPKTAVRGGWGVFMVPINDYQVSNQPGFTLDTNAQTSLNSGLSFAGNLANPFPEGVATPPGSSLGLATLVGTSAGFWPVNQRNGLVQEWQLKVERQLGENWLFSVAYVSNHAYDQPAGTNIDDALPVQYLSKSPTRDQTVINALTEQVPNPFVGLAPGETLGSSKTVAASQLLLPYPEFTGISTQRFDGQTHYNAMQISVRKRFSQEFTFLGNFTWSKLMEDDFFLNPEDTSYVSSISALDAPHVLKLGGVWHLPVGRGLRFGNHWPGVVNAILGGWQASGIYTAQSGLPIGLGDLAYFGNPDSVRANISGNSVSQIFTNLGVFYPGGVINPENTAIQLTDNYRALPEYLPNLRNDYINNLDSSFYKTFYFGKNEARNLKFRADFLNTFNNPFFGPRSLSPTSATDGEIIGTSSNPRVIQLALQFNF